MSATNRGATRTDGDFYETPDSAIDCILDQLDLSTEEAFWFIDPGCGNGAIFARLLARGHSPGCVIGIENDKARAELARERHTEIAILEADFLGNSYDAYLSRLPHIEGHSGRFVIIGNPPYNLAAAFMARAIEIANLRPRSVVALLMRVGFLETKKRATVHKADPSRVSILSERPSFCHSFKCGDCKVQKNMPRDVDKMNCPECDKKMSKTVTDATAYAWFTWGDGKEGTWNLLP